MLFSEIYGAYYRAVGAILTEAAAGTLTPARMTELVREKAFAESVLTIPAALQSGAWPLLTPQGGTPLRHAPTMPLSLLEKRWLKTLLSDPRIALFAPPSDGLEGIEPLYRPQDLVYFDRCADGDPWDDAAYAARFQVILTALREKRQTLAEVLHDLPPVSPEDAEAFEQALAQVRSEPAQTRDWGTLLGTGRKR